MPPAGTLNAHSSLAASGFGNGRNEFVTEKPARSETVPFDAPYQPRSHVCGAARQEARPMSRKGSHAVVIGASMGGLLAARALANHFQSVTVLERDVFPADDIPRKGVPQGRHAHGLLARGCDVIEGFFPGWTDEVVAAGGLFGDIANDVHWVGHGVRLKAGPEQSLRIAGEPSGARGSCPPQADGLCRRASRRRLRRGRVAGGGRHRSRRARQDRRAV